MSKHGNEILIHHWLPIAPNLLFQIKNRLMELAQEEKTVIIVSVGDTKIPGEYNNIEGYVKILSDSINIPHASVDDEKEKKKENIIHYQELKEIEWEQQKIEAYKRVLYFNFWLYPTDEPNSKITIGAKINGRGFVQVSFNYDEVRELFPKGHTPKLILEFCEQVVLRILIQILPERVVNKFAVLEEKIVSFINFKIIEQRLGYIDSAVRFLSNNSFVMLISQENNKFTTEWEDRLLKPNTSKKEVLLLRNSVANNKTPSRITRKSETALLYYSQSQDYEVLKEQVYQFCALGLFTRYLEMVIGITGSLSHDLIQIRREHYTVSPYLKEEIRHNLFDQKRYLGYVTTKLSVIQKIESHLADTFGSPEFKEKLHTLSQSDKLINQFQNYKDPLFSPKGLVNDAEEDFNRIRVLFKDTSDEAKLLSDVLNSTYENELSLQRAKSLDLQVESSRANVELSRSGKNRANALKLLTIVTFANIFLNMLVVALVNSEIFGLWIFFLIQFGILSIVAVIGLILISIAINLYRCQFELVIPLNKKGNINGIRELIKTKDVWHSDFRGPNRTIIWKEYFFAFDIIEYHEKTYIRKKFDKKTQGFLKNMVSVKWNSFYKEKPYKKGWVWLLIKRVFIESSRTLLEAKFWSIITHKLKPLFSHPFDLTLEYNKQGDIYSITLQTEHWDSRFDVRKILFYVCKLFCNIVDDSKLVGEKNVSQIAEIFLKMDIDLDPNYKGLNWLLSQTPEHINNIFERRQLESPITPEEDRFVTAVMEDIQGHIEKLILCEDPKVMSILGIKEVSWIVERIKVLELYRDKS